MIAPSDGPILHCCMCNVCSQYAAVNVELRKHRDDLQARNTELVEENRRLEIDNIALYNKSINIKYRANTAEQRLDDIKRIVDES